MKRIILGAIMGNIAAIMLVSILNIFNPFFRPAELSAVQSLNGFVAVLIGGFIAGHYAQKKSSSRLVILSLIYSIISFVLNILVIFVTYHIFYTPELFAAHLRNLILNVFTSFVGSAVGSCFASLREKGEY